MENTSQQSDTAYGSSAEDMQVNGKVSHAHYMQLFGCQSVSAGGLCMPFSVAFSAFTEYY